MSKATITANTILSYSPTEEGTYQKLVDILDYPDLGATPSKISITTLSDVARERTTLGLQSPLELTFTALYNKTDYHALLALVGNTLWFKLSFNDTDGVFKWSGKLIVYPTGGGVNEVRKMTIEISEETPMTFVAS